LFYIFSLSQTMYGISPTYPQLPLSATSAILESGCRPKEKIKILSPNLLHT